MRRIIHVASLYGKQFISPNSCFHQEPYCDSNGYIGIIGCSFKKSTNLTLIIALMFSMLRFFFCRMRESDGYNNIFPSIFYTSLCFFYITNSRTKSSALRTSPALPILPSELFLFRFPTTRYLFPRCKALLPRLPFANQEISTFSSLEKRFRTIIEIANVTLVALTELDGCSFIPASCQPETWQRILPLLTFQYIHVLFEAHRVPVLSSTRNRPYRPCDLCAQRYAANYVVPSGETPSIATNLASRCCRCGVVWLAIITYNNVASILVFRSKILLVFLLTRIFGHKYLFAFLG